MKRQGVYQRLLALIAVFILPCTAMAQSGLTVNEWLGPEYDNQGIRAGDFVIIPEMKLGIDHNESSSVFTTNHNKPSDSKIVMTPGMDIHSDWSAHFVGIDTKLKSGIHTSESNEYYLDGHIYLNSRIDISEQSFLTGKAGFKRMHEARGASDVFDQWDKPALYNRTSGDLSYHHGIGRASITTATGIVRLDCRGVDGNTTKPGLRDRNMYNIDARLSYDTHLAVNPFVTTRYEWRRYEQRKAMRDADIFRIGIGTGFSVSEKSSIETWVGHMHRNYDDLSDISGFYYGMSLLWNPTRLTSFRAKAQRSIKETAVNGSPGIEAIDAWARTDHRLTKNLLAGVNVNYNNNSYKSVDIKDEYLNFGPRLTYLWNQYFSMDAGHTYRKKDSNVGARKYSENRFDINITGQF